MFRTMILRAVSDLHGRLPQIEPCDVLVIAGDICGHHSDRVGSTDDCLGQACWLQTTFRAWLNEIPAAHVVATWGNHDWVAERHPSLIPTDLRWNLLVDQSTTVAGLKFFGSPWSPWFYQWAFNSPVGDSEAGEPFLRQKWAAIPDDTDVLLVHGPQRGFGDRTVRGNLTGSISLLDRIRTVHPRISVHGHIHEARGQWQVGRTTVVNASVLDEKYRLVWPAMEFELHAQLTRGE